MTLAPEDAVGREVDAARYTAATEDVAVVDRSNRVWISAAGRDPGGMLEGIITGRVPPAHQLDDRGLGRGRAEGSAILSPKGRMISEVRVLRAGPEAEEGLLIELPHRGLEGTLQHFAKYVPPRLAKIAEADGSVSMITLVGPRAAAALSENVLAGRVEAGELRELTEGDLLWVQLGDDGPVTIVSTGEVAAPAWDLVAEPRLARTVRERLVASGAVPIGDAVWETLRVEAGRPLFGVDMDESTIPVEAGIHHRVIDYAKGCFTGQEVIIRIRDRGHVNRHLRGLRMGDAAPPPAETPLYYEAAEKMVGVVTSSVRSPRLGETIALGYVRRQVEPAARVTVGAPDGPTATVHDLESDWGPGPG